MNEESLFRKEVFVNRTNQNYGVVSINTPVHYTVLTIGFTTFVVLVFLFLIFAEFSEKFIVTGYLNSTKGIVRVYPSRSGVIVNSFFQQGDRVKKGDQLFLIDTSYEGLDSKSPHEVFEQIQKRKQAITKEISEKRRYLHDLKKLLLKKYISLTAYNQKREELIELENRKNLIELDLIKHKQENSYVIRSPIDGVIASVIYQAGYYTNQTKPLIKILPDKAELMAELYIPVSKSGFLHKKNNIIIRYDAYPYERFGTAKAVISEISQSILTDEEEDKPVTIGQPYYKVTAQLEKQFITLYGKEKKVQHGMTVSAVIVGSKRKIWQWILDPLYSFYGGLVV